MIVFELIGLLEDSDPDAEVLIVHQPSWPLRDTIHGLYVPDEQPCEEHDNTACPDCGPGEPDPNVYVVAGDHPATGSPYGPRLAWEQARQS